MAKNEFNQKVEAISKAFPDIMRNLHSLAFHILPIGNTDDDQLCAELSLSQMRCLAVFLCDNVVPLKMSDVAKKLNVTLPTVTQIVDKLVSIELLERVRDEEDRRLVMVSITEKGKVLIKMAQDRRRESFKWWLEKLNSEEQKELTNLLEKLMGILERVNKLEKEENSVKKNQGG